jgi:tripartite-type tricarboxylate transporter receptor subunit TctC
LTRGQSYGSVGIGHTGHIWSELLVSENGLKGTHAVYKGTGPLLIDLTTGRLDWAFLASADAAIRSEDKSLKVLAVTGDHRIKQLPGVATMKELGQPGFDMVGWHAVFARSGTPRETLSKIEADLKKALAEPEVRKTLDIQGIEVTGIGGAEFASVVRNDYQRWGELIRRFNIRNE